MGHCVPVTWLQQLRQPEWLLHCSPRLSAGREAAPVLVASMPPVGSSGLGLPCLCSALVGLARLSLLEPSPAAAPSGAPPVCPTPPQVWQTLAHRDAALGSLVCDATFLSRGPAICGWVPCPVVLHQVVLCPCSRALRSLLHVCPCAAPSKWAATGR